MGTFSIVKTKLGGYQLCYQKHSHPVILRALRDGDPEEMIPLHQEIYGKIQATVLEMADSQSESRARQTMQVQEEQTQ